MRIHLFYLEIFEEEVTMHVLGLEIEIVVGPGVYQEEERSAACENHQKQEELA